MDFNIGVFYLTCRVSCLYYNKNMITLAIPGRDTLEIRHLVCDVNGTLACDGRLISGVKESLEKLANLVEIHLVTADTLGKQAEIETSLKGIISRSILLSPGGEAEQKLEYIQKLDVSYVAAVGQGTNDRLMLKGAALGICVLSPEGTALETMLSADVVVPDILAAFQLLLNPSRLKATLRQ